jgi:5-hydroxyisourate hydrolase-like protein (transthyretin family)
VGICSQQESIPFNSSAPDLITAKRMRITSQSNPSSVFVDFLIWSDCFQQTRYYQISSKGVKRTKDGNILHFTYGNNYSLPFFDIINGNCDIGLCTITLKYHIPCLVANNTCYLPNESWSCGEKPAVNGTQQSRNSNGLSEIPAENALKPGRLHSEMPAASMKIAPNPFTDQFRLDYRLQEAGSVRIRLFDATGSAVAEVAPSQWQEEGMHRTDVTLQEELPPGIYFIVLQTDSYRQALPIIKE